MCNGARLPARYLDLLLHCSIGTHVKNLSCWPKFPIAISHPVDAVTLLKHHDRTSIRFVELVLTASQLGKAIPPVLTHLQLFAGEHVTSPSRYSRWIFG